MSGKFRDRFKTQKEIGSLFGLSSIAVGRIFKQAGLRHENGSLTDAAQGYVHVTHDKKGNPYYLWNKERVVPFIEARGHIRTDDDTALLDTIMRDIRVLLEKADSHGWGEIYLTNVIEHKIPEILDKYLKTIPEERSLNIRQKVADLIR